MEGMKSNTTNSTGCQSAARSFCGLLNLNKPRGITSRQVVNMVQRLTRPAKAGHAGTLDPLASGVLVVCVGGATHLIEYVQRMRKRYVGTFLLGRRSPTEDIESEAVELTDAKRPTLGEIEATARRFVGRIEQRPPAFSALKIQGRPAYKLARQGKPVELKPRPVEIFDIQVKAYQYPELVLEIECGSGTYVRSLGRDLAQALGTEAVMSALVRSAIGVFSIEDAYDPRDLVPENWRTHLQPPLRAVGYLPTVQLSGEEAIRIQNGQSVVCGVEYVGNSVSDEFAALDAEGRLVGVLHSSESGRWLVRRNMPTG